MKKQIYAVAAIIIVLLAFPLYQLYALNNVAIETIQVDSVGINSNLQFTVDGTVHVQNPNFIPVTVREMRYTGEIKGQEVFSGTVDAFTIDPKGTHPVEFSEEIGWIPSIEEVGEINAGELNLTIITSSDAAFLYIATLTGEKEVEINIATLVQPLLEQQLSALTNTVAALFG